MKPKTYDTPVAFKAALEQRLRSYAASGTDFARRRQRLVFERFLARVVQVFGGSVLIKGGIVLELRLERARTTKDVDLRVTGAPDDVVARLQEAGRLELADFMTFEVRRNAEHPDIDNDGMKYDGQRHRAECRLAGKLYGQPFGVDIGFGDPIVGEPETIVAEDVLQFAGIAPPALHVYPVVTHVAEKLHAYTLPRKRPNSRVKDLPDIALLATVVGIEAAQLRAALERTFAFRATHAIPPSLPAPPPGWAKPYAAMAAEDSLDWTTLEEVHAAAAAFLDPVLGGQELLSWAPAAWRWLGVGPLRSR